MSEDGVPIRLVLADDHRMLRESLAGLLRGAGEFELVAEVGSGAEALDAVKEHEPDVLIADVNMPPPDGIEVAELLRTAQNAARVVILTMHDEPALVRRAYRAGALGVVLKDDAFDDLRYALKVVHEGRRFLSPTLADVFGDEQPNPELSSREAQVLKLVVSGATSREIAEVLGVSIKTVDTYRARTAQKLGVRTTAELVRVAIQQRLVPAK